jgi:hypothetical protein
LFDTNVSFRVIAGTLGRTRNAVIGKVHREGLRMSPEARAERAQVGEERRLRSREKRKRVRLEHGGSGQHYSFGYVNRKEPNPFVFVERKAPVEPRNVTLVELRAGECHWPYGSKSYTFCGHPATDGHYCREHFNLSVLAAYRRE